MKGIIALLLTAVIAGSGSMTGVQDEQKWTVDPDVGLPAVCEEHYENFGGCDEFIYSDYTFKGELTAEQLAELNPMLIFTGSGDGLTHAVLVGEEPSDALYEKGGSDLQDYYDRVNEVIDNLETE
jgi:hypothetical protein